MKSGARRRCAFHFENKALHAYLTREGIYVTNQYIYLTIKGIETSLDER